MGHKEIIIKCIFFAGVDLFIFNCKFSCIHNYTYGNGLSKILNQNKIIPTFLRWLLKLYHNSLIPHFHIEKTIRITYLWANTVGKGNKKYRGKIISFHISCKKFLPPLPLAFLIYCFSHIAGQYTACWVTLGDISTILRDLFSHKY